MGKQSLDREVESAEIAVAPKDIPKNNERIERLVKYFEDAPEADEGILSNLCMIKTVTEGRLTEFPALNTAYKQLLDGQIHFHNGRKFIWLFPFHYRYFFDKGENGFRTEIAVFHKRAFDTRDYLPKVEYAPATILD